MECGGLPPLSGFNRGNDDPSSPFSPSKRCHPEGRVVCGLKDLNQQIVHDSYAVRSLGAVGGS